jgi:hypothetical protein
VFRYLVLVFSDALLFPEMYVPKLSSFLRVSVAKKWNWPKKQFEKGSLLLSVA